MLLWVVELSPNWVYTRPCFSYKPQLQTWWCKFSFLPLNARLQTPPVQSGGHCFMKISHTSPTKSRTLILRPSNTDTDDKHPLPLGYTEKFCPQKFIKWISNSVLSEFNLHLEQVCGLCLLLCWEQITHISKPDTLYSCNTPLQDTSRNAAKCLLQVCKTCRLVRQMPTHPQISLRG